jgi:hypothetical protein
LFRFFRDSWHFGEAVLIDAEDYGRWQCLWDQLSLLIARLKLLEEHKINSVDSLLQLKALVLDIEVTQSFVKMTAESESDIASPRITEIQEQISLKLAKLEIVARKLKDLPGTPGPLTVDSLKGFRQEISESSEELRSVVTAAFQRLKLK